MNNNDSTGSNESAVFGIGNPLIDVVIHAQDRDLETLGLDKGIMHLVDEDRQQEILAHFGDSARTFRPGGAAPNTLIALAGLGIPSVICGKIGDDEFGRTYDRQVAEYGITSRLIMGSGATGSSIILVTPDGERTMNTHLGMCQEFGAGDLDETLLSASQYLYFTGYMWDTEIQKAGIRRAIDVAKRNDVRVVFDLADPFAVERYRDDFLDLLKRDVDIVFANKTEASILFRNEDDNKNIRSMVEYTPLVALKVGKKGSLIAERGEDDREPAIQSIPGRPIEVVDTTGAGDMYAAGFLYALSLKKKPTEAAQIAGWLAENIIQQVGAQFSVEAIRGYKDELETTPADQLND